MNIPPEYPLVRALLALAMLLMPCAVMAEEAASGPKSTEQAVAAAKAWLALVDEGRYDDSWKDAAPFFQEKVPESVWGAQLESVRKPLGKLVSRELLGAEFHTKLPGAPEGEYVVIQFKTSFENKPVAVETVTPMKDPEGAWRVSGYFIR